MIDSKRIREKNFRNLFFILATFIALENFMAIVSKERILLLLIPFISATQSIFFFGYNVAKGWRTNYYKEFGVFGVINAILFSLIASFLITNTFTYALITFLLFCVVTFFVILIFELLAKKTKTKKIDFNNSEKRYTNRLVCVFIIVLFFVIKYLGFDKMLIIKITSVLLSFFLVFCYFGIIASREENKE